jgi:hypothetical protein
MINKLIDDIIDLVNEQRDSQGMITKVDLTDEVKTLIGLHFKNNGVLDDVINWRFWDDNRNNRIVGFIAGITLGMIAGACL